MDFFFILFFLHEPSMLLMPMFSLSQSGPVGFGKQRSECPHSRGIDFFFLFSLNHDIVFLPIQTDTGWAWIEEGKMED